MCIKTLENSMECDEMLRETMAKLVPTYKYTKEYRKPVVEIDDDITTGKKITAGQNQNEGFTAVVQN